MTACLFDLKWAGAEVIMATERKTKPDRKITAKARQVLAFAEEKARQVADWVELDNALFGIAGKATESFTTVAERTAFSKTAEYKRILALFNTLPSPPVKEMGELLATANGAISVRLPRSVHAALLAEAKAEGVSLNQLCLSKLVAQLRAVV
jgi:predicted HicB family RNase H-like nuclease